MTARVKGGATLFDPGVNAKENEVIGGDERQQTYVLTNRYNLLDFLSGGLITPSVAITKYYIDISERSPGRVPILAAPFAVRLPYDRDDADETAFPVAIEIDSARMGSHPVPTFDRAGEGACRPLGYAHGIVWAPSGAIPIAAAVAIHFRSDRDLHEHRARRYENISDSLVPLKVTPSLFEQARETNPAVMEWLESLVMPEEATAERFDREDRAAGSLALLSRVLPNGRSSLNGFAMLFSLDRPLGTNQDVGQSTRKAAKRPKKAGGTALSSTAGTAAAGDPELPPWLLLSADGPLPATDLEGRLFVAALRVLSKTDPRERWRALEVLDGVAREAHQTKLSEALATELDRNIEPVRGIVSLQRDFRPLNTGKGLVVAKALLMVLLRPDPAKLLGWEQSASGADDSVIMTAAFLAGALWGHKRLPTDLRSPELDRSLAERAAARLGGPDAALTPESVAGSISVSEVADPARPGSATFAVCWRGEPIVVRQKVERSVVDRLLSANLEDEAARSCSLSLARHMGWNDCIESTITLPGDDYSITRVGKPKATVVRCLGTPVILHVLVTERFRERIVVDGIPSESEAHVAELLAACASR